MLTIDTPLVCFVDALDTWLNGPKKADSGTPLTETGNSPTHLDVGSTII